MLYDVLRQSMLCEIYADHSHSRYTEEHDRLRNVWAEAGIELGLAMLRGQIPVEDPGYGRRCLVHFALPTTQEVGDFSAGLAIGVELGEARACFVENAFLNGPFSAKETPDSSKSTDGYFERLRRIADGLLQERNCSFVTMPD